MKTAHLTTATRPAITSTAGALSDRELLRETSNLVRHERHLQGAIIDHLAEIEARGLYLQRGFSSLFDYAVRELGYSDAAAARRIGAMRLCADQPDAREGLRDGSLTLSAAAELQWAFARQRRRGSISGTAAIAPVGSAAQNDPAPDSAPAVPLRSAEAQPPPLVLDAVGRQQLVEAAAGKSARQVRQMLADLDPELAPPADRVRPLGDGRYELKATIDAECQQGLEQLRGLLQHVDPRMTMGQLVGRLVKEGLDRHDPSRPPRRFDAGVAAGCAATRRSRTGAGGAADTDLRAATEHAGGDGPPSRYRGEADGRRHSDGEVMRFGPRDFGGCQTTGVATRRRALQLRRSTDRAPLQLNASDRDRPHRPACAGRHRHLSAPRTTAVAGATGVRFGSGTASPDDSARRVRCRGQGSSSGRSQSAIEAVLPPELPRAIQAARRADRLASGTGIMPSDAGLNSPSRNESSHVTPHYPGLRVKISVWSLSRPPSRAAGHRGSLHRDRCLPQGRASVGLTHTKPGRPGQEYKF